MELLEFLSKSAIIAGLFFMLVSAIGLVRFPDFYSRCHPAGKGDTLGQGLVILGLFIHQIGIQLSGHTATGAGHGVTSLPIIHNIAEWITHTGVWHTLMPVPVKLLLIVFFIFIANPTATHALMRAAYMSGLKPWTKGKKRA